MDTRAALQYEAQQPPLYYALMVLPYSMTPSASMPARVLLLRLINVLIASALVWLTYGIAARVLPLPAAVLVPLLCALFPGLYINVSRVANDPLAIVLVSALLLMCLRLQSSSDLHVWLLAGALLGAALLTKAYCLALVPLLPLIAALRLRNRRSVVHCICALALACTMSGWWYLHSWHSTGSVSGEQLDAAAAGLTLSAKLSAIAQINWLAVADAAAFTHIWVGGWSFLSARSWMYRVIEVILLLGLAASALRPFRDKWVLIAAYLLLCGAVAYRSVMIFLVQKTTAALGWYLHAAIAAELALVGYGLHALAGRSLMAAFAVLLGTLDPFTMHLISIPYYTGFLPRSPSGSHPTFFILDLFQPDKLWTILHRLAVNKPDWIGPAVIATSWGAYLFATFALLRLCHKLLRGETHE